MPTELKIQILPADLAHIVESVFGTMIGLEATQCETPWFSGGDRLTAAIHLMGDWNGAVMLECDERQACRFAARFLTMSAADAVDDVVRDVLGELVNMIGGNLKCVLTQGIHLSMPCIVNGTNYFLRVCGAEVRERLAFESAEGLFWITVLTTATRG
jgi:chemotaxis protein CheX